MANATTPSLLEALRRCRLLDGEQLREVAEVLSPHFPEPRALARELLQRGWLTAYQANQLLQDRGDNLLLGSYLLLERVGEGGMGTVFKARNWKLGRVVAVKVIRTERMPGPEAVRRFRREILAAAQLDHPNIVRALDADEVGGTHLLVMEYVEGTDLAKLVKQHGPLPVDQAVSCVVQAARGLAHAHAAGLVHRDIKPGNLLLDRKGCVKVLDLGLVRFEGPEGASGDETSPEGITQSGYVMGTCDYMAPEQALNSKRADQRADIYSLGCTLWFLLTGTALYGGETAMEKLLAHRERPIPSLPGVRPDAPSELDAVFRRMVAKTPEDRYQAMPDVLAALEGRATEESSVRLGHVAEDVRLRIAREAGPDDTGVEPSPSGATTGPARPRRRLLYVAAAVAAAALGLLGIYFAVRPSPKSAPVAPSGDNSTPNPAPVTFEPEVVRGRTVGNPDGSPFEVVRTPGHFLVGFAVTSTSYLNNYTVVSSVQPLFRSADDPGPVRSILFGRRNGPEKVLRARDGYAVGGLVGRAGARVDGFKVMFLRIKGEVLDPEDAYESEWVGGRSGTPFQLGGDGSPVVGLQCREADMLCQLGLIQASYHSRGDGRYWKAWRQVETVSQQMQECNPSFDGKLFPRIEGEVVTGLAFKTDNVQDLAPLKYLTDLRSLEAVGSAGGKGQLDDLRPLRRVTLTELAIDWNQVSSLEPLRGMRLKSLTADNLVAKDLGPLRDMPLRTLKLNGWKGSDLAPLHDLPLRHLELAWNKQLTDLRPLRGMQLDFLRIPSTGVTDLTPLTETEVRSLGCDGPCLTAKNGQALQAVKSLESLTAPVGTAEQLAAVRPLTRLKQINGQPAALFWQAMDDAAPVRRWQVVGPIARTAAQPFPVPLGGALSAAQLGASYTGLGGRKVGWETKEADGLGHLMLAGDDGKLRNVSCYAYATVEAAAGGADLWVASDDGHALWLNGVKVHEPLVIARSLFVPGDRVRVRLRAGVNHLLIRCDNVGGAWGFRVAVVPDR
jgi:serine/threonine protein kinase